MSSSQLAYVSMTGPDRVGLISAVTARLFDLGANLAAPNFAGLGTGFEFNAVCDVPGDLRLYPRMTGRRLIDYFARLRLGNRDVKVEVIPSPTWNGIPIKITPLSTGGETIDQAKVLISGFQSMLRKLKTDPRSVVWFHVCKDSIPTYLAAREIADQLGVPVGWDIWGEPSFTRNLPPEYTLNITLPPPAPAAPPPEGAVHIPPPKTTLD